jgi:hypothetical protein
MGRLIARVAREPRKRESLPCGAQATDGSRGDIPRWEPRDSPYEREHLSPVALTNPLGSIRDRCANEIPTGMVGLSAFSHLCCAEGADVGSSYNAVVGVSPMFAGP